MDILKLITSLSVTDRYIKTIFMEGGCYQFHLFLKRLYPECIPLINQECDHVVTYYKGNCYDITGPVNQLDYFELNADELKTIKSWSFADRKLLQLGECKYCDEPVVI